MDRYANCPVDGLTPERCAELAKAEKEERLFVLPCKLDTRLFMLVTRCPKPGCPEFTYVKRSRLSPFNMIAVIEGFGKTIFLTEEEAREALKLKEAEKHEAPTTDSSPTDS